MHAVHILREFLINKIISSIFFFRKKPFQTNEEKKIATWARARTDLCRLVKCEPKKVTYFAVLFSKRLVYFDFDDVARHKRFHKKTIEI